MSDQIVVRVVGPALLSQGICVALSRYHDVTVAASESESESSAARSRQPSIASRVTIRADALVAEARRSALPDGLMYSAGTGSSPHSAEAAVLWSASEEAILTACARGIRVVLSVFDDPGTLHRGVLCAARAAYCSPHLLPHVVRALRESVSARSLAGNLLRLSCREHEVAVAARAEELGRR